MKKELPQQLQNGHQPMLNQEQGFNVDRSSIDECRSYNGDDLQRGVHFKRCNLTTFFIYIIGRLPHTRDDTIKVNFGEGLFHLLEIVIEPNI
ncbi:hypothetical protein COCNU_11G005110 [Cocos nucifera]|uniref:Uncharacterized protein n=1 Tax=Cocos nucifera TaxID=13894 RepID=A0A8K0INY6_COCNU|nr:hypothetical protein COCNU_11G005110 [Cocos nucifera]